MFNFLRPEGSLFKLKKKKRETPTYQQKMILKNDYEITIVVKCTDMNNIRFLCHQINRCIETCESLGFQAKVVIGTEVELNNSMLKEFGEINTFDEEYEIKLDGKYSRSVTRIFQTDEPEKFSSTNLVLRISEGTYYNQNLIAQMLFLSKSRSKVTVTGSFHNHIGSTPIYRTEDESISIFRRFRDKNAIFHKELENFEFESFLFSSIKFYKRTKDMPGTLSETEYDMDNFKHLDLISRDILFSQFKLKDGESA